MRSQQPYRPSVVAPTFNNAATVAQVLERLQPLGIDIIVVNDGSTDGTAEILREWAGAARGEPARIVVVHEQNRGKAAALLSGFDHARSLGHAHALTIDTDGQLDPAQAPLLLEYSRNHPDAMVVGTRDARAADYPLGSRLGRVISNWFLRLESGAVVEDSQCGFRVYPLAAISALACRWGRYGFESEVLTRAAWAGVSIRQLPVSCTYAIHNGLVSHFRPWRDSFWSIVMQLQLIGRSLIPWPVHRVGDAQTGIIWRRLATWFSPRRAWRAVRDDPRERSRFAAALATGVFIANLPLYGLHMTLSVVAARLMKLNPLAVVTGSNVVLPPVGPLLVAAAITLGHWLIRRSPPHLSSYDPRVVGYARLLREVLLEWSLGSIVCGAICAATTFVLAQVITRALLRLAPRESEHTAPAAEVHPAAPARGLDRAVAE